MSLRQTRNGSQTAIVSLQRDYADELVRRGKIKMGWATCQIRYRVEISRCFKCLEFGHRSYECRGPDKGNVCINCGKEGHRARECRDTPYCPVCKAEGHRADSMKCALFREMVSEKDSNERKKGK